MQGIYFISIVPSIFLPNGPWMFYGENISLVTILGMWKTRQIRQKDFLFHWAEFIALGFAASDMFPVKFSMA